AATGRVLSRQTEYDANVTRAVLEACRTACAACADECERHSHEHCRVCAEACRRCEQECARLLDASPERCMRPRSTAQPLGAPSVPPPGDRR
ncbi:MAG: four-helix bundle copper-binding protein, partial [Euzebyales bacterium]|nr:four-helix bundle copper-binding protein [Euzebyales bacterium]